MRFSDSFTAAYDVKRVLGEGGMGRVLLAEDRQLKRPVAIKLLAEFDDGPDGLLRQRFVEEARVCAGFKHPHIVRMFTSGFEDGKPYMVFEYIEGEDVAHRIARGPMPVDEVLSIADNVLAGLQYAHDHQVIHRDIKPANILVRGDGEAMLMDFGVAKANSGRTFKTQTNLILGTPLYMAPELIRREEIGPGVDVYALGCALYEMLTGTPPFMAKSDVIVLEMQLHGEPEPLRKVRPDVSEDVELLIARAMQKDAGKRFQSAKEMGGWVDTIRSGGRVPRAKTQPQMPAPPGRNTKPEIVSKTPRASTGVRSRAAATRVSEVAGESPSLIVGRRQRRAGVAVAAIALVAAGAWAWRQVGGAPSDVRLAFGAKGLEVSWTTKQASRGAVFHKALEGAGGANADGTLDRPPSHAQLTRVDETTESTAHRVLIPNLRAGDLVVVSLPGSSGDSAWARAVLVPPEPHARQVPAAVGATSTRVRAATGRVRSVLLEARPLAGEMVPVPPVVPDVAELAFEVPMAPELLSEDSRVRAEQLPGVTLELPVLTMTGAAQRLQDVLDRVSPNSLIAQLVNDKRFDANGDFDNMLGETPMYDGLPKMVAKRMAPEGYFKERVRKQLEETGVLHALEEFRPHADAWFSAAQVPDPKKLALYDRLLAIEQLDQVIRGQLDHPHQLGIAKVYEAFVKARYTLAPPDTPLPTPPAGAVMVQPGGSGWAPDGYTTWNVLAGWTKDYNVYRAMAGAPPPVSEMRTKWSWKRELKVAAVPGAGGSGTAHLKGAICILGPNYMFELSFPGNPPFRLRVSQPATPEWRKVMDDAGSMNANPPYGEFEITFPARLLPKEPVTLEMQYRLLPAPKPLQMQALTRGAMTRDWSLSVR